MNNIEKEVVNLVKKSKAESIILKLILIIVCVVTLVFNSNEYKQVFLDANSINNYDALVKFDASEDRFITLDLSGAKETRFSLQDDSKKDSARIYELSYGGDKNLLIVLKPNTALTNSVKGEYISFNQNLKVIADKLKTDSNGTTDYFDKYFTDMDYSEEENLIKIKFYTTTILILLLMFGVILDFIKLSKPKSTKTYRKYMKKINKKQ